MLFVLGDRNVCEIINIPIFDFWGDRLAWVIVILPLRKAHAHQVNAFKSRGGLAVRPHFQRHVARLVGIARFEKVRRVGVFFYGSEFQELAPFLELRNSAAVAIPAAMIPQGIEEAPCVRAPEI